MNPEVEEVEEIDDSIRADLDKAFTDVEEAPEKPVEKPVKEEKAGKDTDRDTSGKFKKKDEVDVDKFVDAKIVHTPPKSWKAETKELWNTIPEAARKEIERRESEVDAGFTKFDEERNFGKSIKDVVTPYMPIIQAEGGTPATAIQSLLNTAYILRTAPIAQKTALFHQLAQQYGVDLSQPNNTQAVQPNQLLMQTQQQIADLQRQVQQQPEVFRQQQETLAVKSQIEAFAADPKNLHYEKLKPVMASLLQTGQAKDLQDAYDKASWADPDIRSANLLTQTREAEEKRIADIKAKANKSRNVAVSIKGSPSVNPVANGSGTNSIADDLRAAWDDHAA